jgi:hypothetical protein
MTGAHGVPPSRRPHRVAWLHRPTILDRPTGPPNPFEAVAFATSIVIGIAAATGYARPAAFHNILPAWGRIVWGVLMAVGGIAAVAGLYWPGDPVDGILIKRVGMVALGPSMIAYGLAGLFTDPSTRIVASLFAIALGVACIWRTRQVTAAIAGLHRQLRGLRKEWENGDSS